MENDNETTVQLRNLCQYVYPSMFIIKLSKVKSNIARKFIESTGFQCYLRTDIDFIFQISSFE